MNLEKNGLDYSQRQLLAKYVQVLEETDPETLLSEYGIGKDKKEAILQEASGNTLTVEQLQIKYGISSDLRKEALLLPDIDLPEAA